MAGGDGDPMDFVIAYLVICAAVLSVAWDWMKKP